MSHITVNGVSLYYEDVGSGPETLVFSHGLLMSGEMFSAQVEALRGRFRCVCYDHRGQARSEVTASGYDMDTLADDAIALIEGLGCAPCHFVGLSMGGFVGMRLAIKRPDLLKSLALMETSADPEPNENKAPYRTLAFIGRWLGFRPVTGRLMGIMFGRTFLQDPEKADARARWRRHLLGLGRTGTARAAHGVIDRQGVYEQLGSITTPTLIVVGDEDIATVPARSERMHRAIPDSKLVVIPGAGHSSCIEQPDAVTRALQDFLPD